MLYYRRRTGERFLGKQLRFRKGSWIILPLAIAAWFTPISTVQATNILDNGTFDGPSGWIVSQNGGSGVTFNGALKFSYELGEVFQTVSVSPGATLNVSFTVDNSQTNSIGQGAISDTWTATLSSDSPSPASATVTRSVAHGSETFNLSITVPQGATTATITFSGMDNGYWAGSYGPTVDDVSLSSTPAPAISTGLLVRGYNISQNPPDRVDSETPDCTDEFDNIDNWPAPGAYMAGCRTNQVMLHYTGNIVIPSDTVTFRVYSDDGAWVHVADNEFGRWGLRGCSYTESPQYTVSSGESLPIDAWFYEWGGGECFKLYWDIGDGFVVVPASAFSSVSVPTTTTTTTLAPYLNAPRNLTVTSTNATKVYLAWDAPESSNVEVERYAVFFSSDNFATSFAIASTQTNAVVENLEPGTQYQFKIRADNDTLSVYSDLSNIVEGTTDVPPTTTTTTTTTTTIPEETTTTWPEQTTTTIPSEDVPTTTVPVTSTVPTETTTDAPAPVTETTEPTTDAPVEENVSPETTVAEPETTIPETTPDTQPEPDPEQPTGDVTTEDLTDLSSEELADELDNLSTEELTTLVESIDEPDQLEALVDAGAVDLLDTDQLLSIIDNPVFTELSAEAFSEVLTTVLDEPLTDEQFDSVIDAVLDAPISDEQFDALVDALGSDAVSDEQVQSAVDQIIDNGLTEEFATSLATSPEILTSIDGEAATEIFAEVPVSDLTDEEATQIVEAVQDAPDEVRQSFETEINIFGAGNFDIYVPIGSTIDVGTRRVVIAATTVVSVLTVASPPTAPSPSSGGSGSSGGPSSPTGSGTGSASESASQPKRRRLFGGR